MKDAYYFSHDSNARNDQRLVKVRMKYGMEGYGIYFGIIEILREQENYILYNCDVESIAFDLRVDVEKINDIVHNQSLFEARFDASTKEGYFYSKSLTRRMEKLDLIKQKRAEAGRKGGKVKPNAKQVLSNSLTSKVKNSKVKDMNERYDDFDSQSKEYVLIYGEDTINDFVTYWTEPNKSDTKMKFELQQTFDIKRRLKRWASNDFNGNKKNGVKNQHNFKMPDGKNYLAWCSECLKSDFYESYNFNPSIIESKCCNAIIIDENEKNKRSLEKLDAVR